MRELQPEAPTRRTIPVIYAASPALPPEEREHWVKLIVRFANETSTGKQWIQGLKYDALQAPTADDMASLDADVRELKRLHNPGIWK